MAAGARSTTNADVARQSATTLSEEVAKRGVFVGRAPLDYHDMHFAQTMPGFQQACAAIKKALDPKGVIAPGRYGIN